HSRCCSEHTASLELDTLSLHDALPICPREVERHGVTFALAGTTARSAGRCRTGGGWRSRRRRGRSRWTSSARGTSGAEARSRGRDRKSTRLNSSHEWISYAVFCLKKKK